MRSVVENGEKNPKCLKLFIDMERINKGRFIKRKNKREGDGVLGKGRLTTR